MECKCKLLFKMAPKYTKDCSFLDNLHILFTFTANFWETASKKGWPRYSYLLSERSPNPWDIVIFRSVNVYTGGHILQAIAQALYGYGYSTPFGFEFVSSQVKCGLTDFQAARAQFAFLENADITQGKLIQNVTIRTKLCNVDWNWWVNSLVNVCICNLNDSFR